MTHEELEKKAALVFVYNAESGVFNTLGDMAHKLFSPATYACNLCALTHSTLGMRREWREFLEGLDAALEFLHADELRSRYGMKEVALPAVFKRQRDGLEVLIDAAAINSCRTLDELKQLIAARVKRRTTK